MGDEQARVRADVVSVEELFKENSGLKLRIPAYQRPYEWKTEQVVALCRDILAADAAGRQEYPTGTLVLHKNLDDNCLDIVDGQQRLTTFCLLAGKEGGWHLSGGGSEEDFGKLQKEVAQELLDKVVRQLGDAFPKVQKYLPHCTFVRIIVEDEEEAFQLFDTQNGRGKALSPANLLKAYHFHAMTHGGPDGRAEVDRERLFELEGMWENISQHNNLNFLLTMHLFRLRRWCLSNDSFAEFDKSLHLGIFKGVTLGDGSGVSPCHAGAFLRRFYRRHYGSAGLALAGMPARMGDGERDPAGLDPFVSIAQPIVDGEDFFLYVQTFALAYKLLFDDSRMVEQRAFPHFSALKEFRDFYKKNCCEYSRKSINGTGKYSRYVFESLCLLLFDRFGLAGLMAHHKLMYRFAYWECSRQNRVWRQSPGQAFAGPAAKAMLANETLAELNEKFTVLASQLDSWCDGNPYHGEKEWEEWYQLPREQRMIVGGRIMHEEEKQ